MRGDSERKQKAYKSFISLINPSIEHVIQTEWVKKINRKEEIDKRYFVSTTAGMYMCKSHGLFSVVKILHRYPWVDLIIFQIVDDNNILFSFKHNTIKIQIEDASKFITPTASFLSTFFKSESQKLVLPESYELIHSVTSQCLFTDILISCLYSLNKEVKPTLIQKVQKRFKKDQTVEIHQGSREPYEVKALLRALELDSSVQTLEIGGSKFENLYKRVSDILKRNHSILYLAILDYDKTYDFQFFVDAIGQSSLRSLILQGVKIDGDLATALSQCNYPDCFESLGFQNCSLDGKCAFTLFESEFNVPELTITDQKEFPIDVISSIGRFQAIKALVQLSLVNLNLEIMDVFNAFNNTQIEIRTLDLSENICTNSKFKNVKLPPSIQNLALDKVQWTKETLVDFLAFRPFAAPISLTISNIKYQNPPPDPFEGLPCTKPSNLIERLDWSGNPISLEFFRFLSSMQFLQELKLEFCLILPRDESTILSAIAEFIDGSILHKLSLNGTLKYYKLAGIVALKESLIRTTTLRTLNYCNNHIGDEGLSVLLEILTKNNSISRVGFGGANLQSPSLFCNFLKALQNLPHLSHVSKPRRDFAKLLNRAAPEEEREIRGLWESVSEVTSSNASRTSSFFELSVASTMSLYESARVDSGKVSYVGASWETNIDVGYDNCSAAWVELSNTFSYENILGVSHLVDSAQSDPSNLIMFD